MSNEDQPKFTTPYCNVSHLDVFHSQFQFTINDYTSYGDGSPSLHAIVIRKSTFSSYREKWFKTDDAVIKAQAWLRKQYSILRTDK